jgi:hypothetical protein
MMRILSDDLTIQIGEIIYYVNLFSDEVRAIHEANFTLYEEMLGETISDPRILVFSTFDNVLDEIENIKDPILGDDVIIDGKGRCREPKAPEEEDYTSKKTFSPDGINRIYYWGSNIYERGGLWCSLYIESTKEDYFEQTNMWVKYDDVFYTPRCRTKTNVANHPWYSSRAPHNNSNKRQFYRSTRRLLEYNIKSKVRIEDPSNNEGNNPYTTHFSNEIHINHVF